ncbi:Soluble starch synthase 3, chloroplastic/amyloplastic [Vitis vinifera]|uniref:starch synthase n=2 Tax=Vitis vinifera TaxID=29760 RepID=A0A438EEN7_VITVI|nr:Soluble starch synthase 3, chloroplastic/amyloplastic [Vitis vinifera]
MEMLQKLLSQVGSGSTTGVAFTANRGGMKPWIVDTGASDHMTGDGAILQNYKPSNGHSSVHIADGSKSKIAGTGLEIGKMIGSAELCSGLYLLSCGQFSNQVSQASCVQSQILKSDNAKEYFTSSLSTYLQNHDIIHISSCVDTPQQNGVAERKNRHLLEVARCLMFSSNVPNYFWGEAILTATYLINRMPSRVLTFQSPRQLFLKQFPHTRAASSDLPLKGESMNEHQVWESLLEGVPSFHSESPNPSQFAPTELSTPMPSSVQPAQHTNVPSPVTIQSPMPIQPIAPQLANENLQVYIRRRKRQELEHGSQSTCGQYIDSNSSLPEENIGEDRVGEVLIPSIDDSTLLIALRKGVRRCTDHPIGNYVTYEGLSPSYRAFATSLDDTQILPVGKRPVGCKWIFTIKYKADGSVERFKARLVARGFTQSYGIDYQETFAPVAKLNTIRILLSLAVNQDWCLQQLDIKNAFLNGDLEEEVYMEIPPGFEESMAKNQVCKLQKSLYGLKQSPRAWFDRFTKAVLKLGYKQGQADHTLFVKKSRAGKMTILIVYVDDIILSGNDMEELQNLKKYLSEEFEIKDLGNLKYFLGMEVARSRKGIVVSQRKYILDLLKETGMLGCKLIDTPMDSQKKLGIEKESTPVDRGRYQRLVGRLIYLSHTRPDIGFARSKKQSVVARSSAEAEYRALAQGICSYKHSKEPVHHDRTKHVEIDRHFITEKSTTFLIKCVFAVKVPLDAYMMDFVFSEREDGGIFDNRNGMDYHIPVFGSVVKEPPMHIVHIAVEMAPIAKVGGLGDVVTSLSRAVQELNHHVDIILPKYDCLNLSNVSFNPIYILWQCGAYRAQVKDFQYKRCYFWGGTEIKVWFGKVEGLSVYFLEPQNGKILYRKFLDAFSLADFFSAGCIYGCRNDGERFGFFCHAALEFLLQSGFHPDIIHCHDWSSAPVSWLFKDHYKHYGLSKARVVFTIHNLEFGAPLIAKAMVYTDKATTVSHTYSREVSGNPAIAPHLYKFHGILNGIDLDIWDPYNDKFIPVPYTSDNVVEGKRAAKEALQQRLGLKKSDFPLVGIITRLTHQKGIHLIKHAIWRTLERNGQVVLLGSAPDPRIQNDFVNLANQLHSSHGDRARLCLTYDEPLSHLIYAGADFILVPSIFEPCGLTQLTAMRYGSIPVVRKTGGLYDTVFDVDHDKERAQAQGLEPNGFNFDGADSVGVDYALNRAISAWYDGRDWFNSLCKQVMEQDWSWNRPALDYMELYHAARK